MTKIVEEVEIRADASQAKRESTAFEKALTGAFLKANIAAEALSKAIAGVSGFISDGVKSALEYHDTNIKLRAALQITGHAVEANVRAMNAQSAAMELNTGISDEIIRGMQAQAIAMGVGAERVDAFTRAAIALNASMGLDLNSSMRNLLKTMSGMKGELGEVLPFLRGMTEEELRSGKAIDEVNKRLGEFVTAMGEGEGGRVRKASAQWESLKEQIVLTGMALNDMLGSKEAGKSLLERVTDALLILERRGVGALVGANDKEASNMANALRALDQNAARLESMFADMKNRGIIPKGINSLSELVEMQSLMRDAGVAEMSPRPSGATPSESSASRAAAIAAKAAQEKALSDELERSKEYARKQIAIEAQRASDTLVLENMVADGRREIAENNAIRIADIEIRENERALEAKRMHAEKEDALRARMIQNTTSYISFATNSIMDGFEQAIESGRISGQEIAKQLLRGLGRMMIAHGIANHLQAGASIAMKKGIPDQGDIALAAVGTAQIAAGGTLWAGGLLLSSPKGGGISGGSAASGGADGFGVARMTSGGGFSSGGSSSSGGGNITMVFNGPTTAAEVGVAIEKARGAARSEGLI